MGNSAAAYDDLYQDQVDLSENLEERKMGLYRRIYPHTKEVVQHAVDRYDADEDEFPRIVRDRQAALRAERMGEGDAIARVWEPGEWYYLTDGDGEDDES